jgi:rRNA maturation RNase YbeY
MNKIEVTGKLPNGCLVVLEKLYKKYNRYFKKQTTILSLALVDEKEMAKLNRRFFGKNKPTDVLSFEDSDEIIICLPVARLQAKQEKKKLNDEIALLFVHGCLHVAGLDHNNEKAAKEMTRWQKKILGDIPGRELEFRK